MSLWRQLKFLLRKNYLIRVRQKKWAILEIVWPLFLFAILVWIRTGDFTEAYHECHYVAKAMPSAGFLPFSQSYFCTFVKTTCFKYARTDADVGLVNTEHSLINFLAKNVQIFLGSNASLNDTEKLLENVQRLVEFSDKLIPAESSPGVLNISTFLTDKEEFLNLVESDGMTRETAQNWIDSGMEPSFFVSVADMLKSNHVEIDELFDLSVDNIFVLYSLLSNIRQDLYCNFTNFEKNHILHDAALAAQTASELCSTDFFFFFSQVYQKRLISPNALNAAVAVILQNLTGYQFNATSISDLRLLVQDFRKSMSDQTPVGKILRHLMKSGEIQESSDDSVFRRSVCGDMTEGADDAFRGKTNIERMRDRFQGEKVHKSELLAIRNRSILNSGRAQESDVESALKYSLKPISLKDDDLLQEGVDNGTKILCDLIPIDLAFESKCWDWLKDFNVPSGFLAPIFSIMRGFILVSPEIEPVKRISQKLANWLENVVFLKKLLADLDLNAAAYQDVFFNSDVAKAVKRTLKIVYALNNLTHLLPKNVEKQLELLNSLFLNSSDSEAFFIRMRQLILPWIDAAECFRTNRFIILSDEKSLEKLAMCLTDFNEFFGAVTFQNLSSKAENLDPLTAYKIRLANYLTDATFRIQDKTWNPRPRDRPFIDLKYLYYGFSHLQDAVDKAIIEEQTNSILSIGVYTQQFPNPCFAMDGFVKAMSRLLPLCMTLAWVLSASLIIKNVVHEKEMRLKEFMKIMGLGNLVHWVAWFLQTFSVVLISIFAFVTLVKVGRVIEKADVTVLLVFLSLYATATITQCFLVSTLFGKANLAAACGGFIYFLLFLPYPISMPFVDIFTFGQKAALCLVAQVAFGFGCSYISLWEENGEGLKWSNLNLSPDLHDNFSCFWPMLMLVLDSFLYSVAAWYIETVFPGAYGIPRPWYFFVQKSYWFGEYCSENPLVLPTIDGHVSTLKNENVEKVSNDARVGVKVVNLCKTYDNGKVAVDGLNVDFYENQITAFLGHNGAGKTTTISILTGLYPPTSGTVLVNGKDIRCSITQIRQSLGMCPQHNVLFDLLTVEEQLRFYAGLKGLKEQEIQDEIKRMLKMLNLESARKLQAKYLSGGLQRKLSIAVAFMGNSKIVVLDEPTAGVDPFSRRQIWNLLTEQKKGRTIILSTHHMDEADLLGDRIAIIGSGKLKCCGSSLFLKKLFGSGYYLTFVLDNSFRRKLSFTGQRSDVKLNLPPKTGQSSGEKDVQKPVDLKKVHIVPKSANIQSAECSTSSSSLDHLTSEMNMVDPVTDCSTATVSVDYESVKNRLQRFIDSHVRGGCFVERVGQEIIFTLPRDQPQRLASLFAELDRQLGRRGVDEPEEGLRGVVSYGVSETTLEEVFLKVDPKGAEAEKHVENAFEKISSYLSHCLKRNHAAKETVEMADTSSSDEGDVLYDKPLVKDAPDQIVAPIGQRADHGFWWIRRRQFRAIFVKRFFNFCRNKKGAFCEIFLPVIVIALTMFGLSLQPSNFSDQPSLRLSPWLYGPPNYVFYTYAFRVDNTSNSSNEMAREVLNGMVKPPGLSYRCMPTNPFKDLKCEVVKNKKYQNAKTYKDVVMNESACYCDKRSDYECPLTAYTPTPPTVLLNTTDYLTNMTMLNITQWLLMTERKFRRSRYGGFSLGELNPSANENISWPSVNENLRSLSDLLARFSYQMGFNWNISKRWDMQDISLANESVLPYPWTLNFTNSLAQLLSGLEIKNNVKVWFNNQGWASLPSYVNVLSNAILRASLPKTADPTSYGIIAFNHPMNYSKTQQGQRVAYGYNVGVELTAAVMIILSFSVIPASFVLFIIDERISDSKHLQFVSGVGPNIYWIANFVWDLTNFLVPVTGVMLVFVIFHEMAYVGWFRQFMATLLLLYTYGFATIPMMYTLSHLFRIPSLAFICLATSNLFFGWITTTLTATLELLGQDDPYMFKVSQVLMQVFLLLPQYCLGRGMLDLKIAYFLYLGEQFAYGEATPANPFRWQVLGRNYVVLIVEGILAFMFVLFIENYKRKAKSDTSATSYLLSTKLDEDDDVVKEREFVASPESADCAVRIINLTKVIKI